MKRVAVVLVLVCLGTLASYNVFFWQMEDKPQAAEIADQMPLKEHRVENITLTAAGDCLMHNTQIWSGLQPDGTYQFDGFFSDVRDLIQEGDYSSIDFEAPMAGPATGYTGYPLFNSPDAMATAFKNAGFDLVVTANNHAMDRGYQGAMRTLKVLREAELDTVGTYTSAEESKSYLIKDIRGVKVGYLAYSFSTNGIPIPASYSYIYNYLDKDKILQDIKNLRPQVDVLILILHWGLEYHTQPSSDQQAMAREFLAAGADVILGNHPHVIQTMEAMNINGKDKFVIYAMGNFIGHQIGLERNCGIVLKMKFRKDYDNKETTLTQVSYTPTYSQHYYQDGKLQFRVVPIEKAISDVKAGKEAHLGPADLPVLQEALTMTREQLGPDWYSQET